MADSVWIHIYYMHCFPKIEVEHAENQGIDQKKNHKRVLLYMSISNCRQCLNIVNNLNSPLYTLSAIQKNNGEIIEYKCTKVL